MKNNCDVSGWRTKCTNAEPDTSLRCRFFESNPYDKKTCLAFVYPNCNSLAAIRAAIEAEGMKMNCPDCGAEKTLLCDCWEASDHIANAGKKWAE